MQKEQQGGMRGGGRSADESRTGARVSHSNTDLLAYHHGVLDEGEPENELDKKKYFERQRKSREWLDRREERSKYNKIAMMMGSVRERFGEGERVSEDWDIPEDAAEETHARDALPRLPPRGMGNPLGLFSPSLPTLPKERDDPFSHESMSQYPVGGVQQPEFEGGEEVPRLGFPKDQEGVLQDEDSPVRTSSDPIEIAWDALLKNITLL